MRVMTCDDRDRRGFIASPSYLDIGGEASAWLEDATSAFSMPDHES
jgi:hypothetical protein